MRREEAAWIGHQLRRFQPDEISPVLELGSATGHFRTVLKPHIDREIHAPLRGRGVLIVHSDITDGDGVDICGDVRDPDVRERLVDVGARCVLCCNMFEHVEDREGLARLCADALAPSGILIVSVPRSYPYHLGPIDTYYRPSPEEIASMFPGFTLLAAETLEAGNYWQEIREAENFGLELVRTAAKVVLPLGGLEMWKSRLHRFLWLTRPYIVAAVVLRKSDTPNMAAGRGSQPPA
jgi:SAM-dependent methyltransferase